MIAVTDTDMQQRLADLEAQNKRLADELAVRSRELGEAIQRAEKAEKYGKEIDGRFEIQRKGILEIQGELAGAKESLRAVTDAGTGR